MYASISFSSDILCMIGEVILLLQGADSYIIILPMIPVRGFGRICTGKKQTNADCQCLKELP